MQAHNQGLAHGVVCGSGNVLRDFEAFGLHAPQHGVLLDDVHARLEAMTEGTGTMRNMLIIMVLIFIFVIAGAADALTGAPRIVDGDTIWIGESKIRLHGIDAPEARQECLRGDGTAYHCGQASTNALRALVGSQPVRCEGNTIDRYKRLIAVCYAGSINLNAEVVRQGWALTYRRYSKDYVSVEMEAQEARRGIWAGSFEAPWKWRQHKR